MSIFLFFCLRAGHNRLKHHRYCKLHLVSSLMCLCGDVKQTTEHIQKECRSLQELTTEVWQTLMFLDTKLHVCQMTASFISGDDLQVD